MNELRVSQRLFMLTIRHDQAKEAGNMGNYKEWDGTEKEAQIALAGMMEDIRLVHFSELGEKTCNQIFLEALHRDLVQNDLVDMMAFIVNNECDEQPA